MTLSARILVLAGSAEARQIAERLAGQGRVVRALMSEPPRAAQPLKVPHEVIENLAPAAMEAAVAKADVVIDASHGFDDAMTQMGVHAAKAAGVPLVCYQRPSWDATAQTRWRTAADVAEAMTFIAPGARVFSATGWASLPECADFPGARLMLRQTSRHHRPPPYDFVELVFGDPPFSVADERALFEARKVDTLMCRNLGGRASRPKLDAAAELDLNVILVDRPALPVGVNVLESIEDVLDWVAAL